MWILFVIMVNGNASPNIDHAEFSSPATCAQALAVLKNDKQVKTAYCVKK